MGLCRFETAPGQPHAGIVDNGDVLDLTGEGFPADTIVGGKLQPVLGKGIRDIPVHPATNARLASTLASHNHYWTLQTAPPASPKQPSRRSADSRPRPPAWAEADCITALRSALALSHWKR
jgi:hypothetical protein